MPRFNLQTPSQTFRTKMYPAFSLLFVLPCLALRATAIRDAEIADAYSVTNNDSDETGGVMNEPSPEFGGLGSNLCFREHNQARESNGRSRLEYSDQLERAAINHNRVMVEQNCFSHQCSGEPSLGQRISSVGYRWSGAGENIAKGQRDCAEVMRAWMNSSGHRANILGDYKHVGCDKQGPYWTCVFARPR